MAYVDYKHCVVCDAKAFYDANLNWRDGSNLHDINGHSVGHDLDNCAQVEAICVSCYERGWRLVFQKPKTER